MEQTAKIIEFNKELSYDDIKCVLNPVHVSDLKQILSMTPVNRRFSVALSFANITPETLAMQAGLYNHENMKLNNTWRRWLRHECKIPLGAAFRFAKVLGISVELLFSSPKWRQYDSQR